MPKRSHPGVMCSFAGAQCGGFYLLTRFWSSLTPNVPEFLSFPESCALVRAHVSDPEPWGNSGGCLLGGKEGGSSSEMCDHGRTKGQCFFCDQDGNVQEARGKAVLCSLPALWGNVWSSALCFPQMKASLCCCLRVALHNSIDLLFPLSGHLLLLPYLLALGKYGLKDWKNSCSSLSFVITKFSAGLSWVPYSFRLLNKLVLVSQSLSPSRVFTDCVNFCFTDLFIMHLWNRFWIRLYQTSELGRLT